MKVFTLCDGDNITNFFVAHHKQEQIALAIRKKSHSVNEPSEFRCATVLFCLSGGGGKF